MKNFQGEKPPAPAYRGGEGNEREGKERGLKGSFLKRKRKGGEERRGARGKGGKGKARRSERARGILLQGLSGINAPVVSLAMVYVLII